MKPRYGSSEERLAHYTCFRASGAVEVDGDLAKPVWAAAPRSPRFVDLVTGEPAFLDTRVACLWDQRALYIGFWIQEPDVRATLTKRDSFIWHDNDVEVFIGGDDCYYEFEINAFGTIYEVFYVWQHALTKGSRFDRPEFDLYARDVDVLGGFQDATRVGKHPRGRRWAFMDWDFPGLRSAVKIHGSINESTVVDDGWTVELALPWDGMRPLFAERPLPPGDGDILRLSFSRFEALRYMGRTVDPSPGWALNPHGVYDSHIPECFSYVHFTTQVAEGRGGAPGR
jgi:hypothetical protein